MKDYIDPSLVVELIFAAAQYTSTNLEDVANVMHEDADLLVELICEEMDTEEEKKDFRKTAQKMVENFYCNQPMKIILEATKVDTLVYYKGKRYVRKYYVNNEKNYERFDWFDNTGDIEIKDEKLQDELEKTFKNLKR